MPNFTIRPIAIQTTPATLASWLPRLSSKPSGQTGWKIHISPYMIHATFIKMLFWRVNESIQLTMAIITPQSSWTLKVNRFVIKITSVRNNIALLFFLAKISFVQTNDETRYTHGAKNDVRNQQFIAEQSGVGAGHSVVIKSVHRQVQTKN